MACQILVHETKYNCMGKKRENELACKRISLIVLVHLSTCNNKQDELVGDR